MENKNPAQTSNPDTHFNSSSTPTQPPEHIQKLPLWLIITSVVLLLIITSAATAFFVAKNLAIKTRETKSPIKPDNTATPVQSSEWTTYSNTKYNFSVDYPGNWSIREYPQSRDGASFNPVNKPGYPDKSDAITISAGQTMGNYKDMSFEEYAKIAASAEIQNFNSLASLKKVTTAQGIIGYETTWKVQSMMGAQGSGPSESSPITYFELPGNKTMLVRVYLNRDEDLAVYEKMLTTVKITSPSPAPSVDETTLLKKVIKDAIGQENNSDVSSLNITVSEIAGNFAKGGASAEGGGGIWFAAKVNGIWELVWDGNGSIFCSDLASYPDFPPNMIPECWNDKTQKTVKR